MTKIRRLSENLDVCHRWVEKISTWDMMERTQEKYAIFYFF